MHAVQSPDALERPGVKIAPRSGIRVALGPERELERQHARGIESEIRPAHAADARHHERAADEQRQRQCHLGHHHCRARARVHAPEGAGAARAQGERRRCASRVQSRHEAEEEAGADREQERVAHDHAVEPDRAPPRDVAADRRRHARVDEHDRGLGDPDGQGGARNREQQALDETLAREPRGRRADRRTHGPFPPARGAARELEPGQVRRDHEQRQHHRHARDLFEHRRELVEHTVAERLDPRSQFAVGLRETPRFGRPDRSQLRAGRREVDAGTQTTDADEIATRAVGRRGGVERERTPEVGPARQLERLGNDPHDRDDGTVETDRAPQRRSRAAAELRPCEAFRDQRDGAGTGNRVGGVESTTGAHAHAERGEHPGRCAHRDQAPCALSGPQHRVVVGIRLESLERLRAAVRGQAATRQGAAQFAARGHAVTHPDEAAAAGHRVGIAEQVLDDPEVAACDARADAEDHDRGDREERRPQQRAHRGADVGEQGVHGYSVRSARIGSMRVARCAGTQAASSDDATRMRMTPT